VLSTGFALWRRSKKNGLYHTHKVPISISIFSWPVLGISLPHIASQQEQWQWAVGGGDKTWTVVCACCGRMHCGLSVRRFGRPDLGDGPFGFGGRRPTSAVSGAARCTTADHCTHHHLVLVPHQMHITITITANIMPTPLSVSQSQSHMYSCSCTYTYVPHEDHHIHITR